MDMNTASGCCDNCATNSQDTALAIACTLGAGDFKERVAGIRALAARSLRSSRRKPLQLELVYGPEALTEVEDLVAKESDCCSFLNFDLEHDAQAVRLTITAPVEALAAADELFAHFAPELAREAA
jgi:hypothetical protein